MATSNRQVPFLDRLSTLSADPRLRTSSRVLSVSDSDSLVPAYFLSSNEAREMEPDLGSNVVGALLITETGIVDSQGLVDSLAREIEEEDYLGANSAEHVGVGLASSNGKAREDTRGEGVIVLGTRVVRIDREENGQGWVVQLETGWEGLDREEKGEVESVKADVVVNAAGLGSTALLEGIVPESQMVQMWPVKGMCILFPIIPRQANVLARQLHVVQGTRGREHQSPHLPVPERQYRSSGHPPREQARRLKTCSDCLLTTPKTDCRSRREHQIWPGCRSDRLARRYVPGPGPLALAAHAGRLAHSAVCPVHPGLLARHRPGTLAARLFGHTAQYRTARRRLLRFHDTPQPGPKGFYRAAGLQ